MGQMRLVLPRPMRPVTHDDLAKKPSFHAAIRTAMEESGLQDKSIAIETEIDPGQLSKIASGQAGIQQQHLSALMRVCGSYLPLFYLNWAEGFDPLTMRQRETELERLLREKDEELARKDAAIQELLRGRALCSTN